METGGSLQYNTNQSIIINCEQIPAHECIICRRGTRHGTRSKFLLEISQNGQYTEKGSLAHNIWIYHKQIIPPYVSADEDSSSSKLNPKVVRHLYDAKCSVKRYGSRAPWSPAHYLQNNQCCNDIQWIWTRHPLLYMCHCTFPAKLVTRGYCASWTSTVHAPGPGNFQDDLFSTDHQLMETQLNFIWF